MMKKVLFYLFLVGFSSMVSSCSKKQKLADEIYSKVENCVISSGCPTDAKDCEKFLEENPDKLTELQNCMMECKDFIKEEVEKAKEESKWQDNDLRELDKILNDKLLSSSYKSIFLDAGECSINCVSC